jgi:hypothetical protein
MHLTGIVAADGKDWQGGANERLANCTDRRDD